MGLHGNELYPTETPVILIQVSHYHIAAVSHALHVAINLLFVSTVPAVHAVHAYSATRTIVNPQPQLLLPQPLGKRGLLICRRYVASIVDGWRAPTHALWQSQRAGCVQYL